MIREQTISPRPVAWLSDSGFSAAGFAGDQLSAHKDFPDFRFFALNVADDGVDRFNGNLMRIVVHDRNGRNDRGTSAPGFHADDGNVFRDADAAFAELAYCQQGRFRTAQNQGVRMHGKDFIQQQFHQLRGIALVDGPAVDLRFFKRDAVFPVHIPECLGADFHIIRGINRLDKNGFRPVQGEQILHRLAEVRVIVRRNEREFFIGHGASDEDRVGERFEQPGNFLAEIIVMRQTDHTLDIIAEEVIHITFDGIQIVVNQTDLKPVSSLAGLLLDRTHDAAVKITALAVDNQPDDILAFPRQPLCHEIGTVSKPFGGFPDPANFFFTDARGFSAAAQERFGYGGRRHSGGFRHI